MNNVSEQAQQLVDLQSRVSFQEDAMQTMSEQLAWQAAELRKSNEQLQALNQKLNDLFSHLEEATGAPVDERPPHY